MKLKRNALIILILGVLMSVLGFIAPIVYWNNYTLHNGAMGIIGGADAPTYTFRRQGDGSPVSYISLKKETIEPPPLFPLLLF